METLDRRFVTENKHVVRIDETKSNGNGGLFLEDTRLRCKKARTYFRYYPCGSPICFAEIGKCASQDTLHLNHDVSCLVLGLEKKYNPPAPGNK